MNPTDKPINLDAMLPDFESQEIARLTAEREHNANMADMWRSVAEGLKRTLTSWHNMLARDDDERRFRLATMFTGEYLEQALEAYASAKEHDGASGWRPIETAPKDEDILVWDATRDKPQIAWWMPSSQGGGFRNLGGNITTAHWQPLPPAPKTP